MEAVGSHNGSEPRRRRPLLAFALNLVFCPAGYIYAGFPRTALATCVIMVGVGVAVGMWTITVPPGIYGVFSFQNSSLPLKFTALAWTLTALLGAHAAWLCTRPPRWTPRATRLWLAAAGSWVLLLSLALLVRLFAPFATYAVASVSMEPSLSVGDIVLSHSARGLCGRETIHPGDVVLFRRAGAIYISRAIADGDETIELKNGVPIIDGKPASQRLIVARRPPVSEYTPDESVLEETLPGGRSYRIAVFREPQPQDTMAEHKVSPGHWFLLGDNRDDAMDSRFRGDIGASEVCAVAMKVLYSKEGARIGGKP